MDDFCITVFRFISKTLFKNPQINAFLDLNNEMQSQTFSGIFLQDSIRIFLQSRKNNKKIAVDLDYNYIFLVVLGYYIAFQQLCLTYC